MSTTAGVLEHHLDAFGNQDLEEVMADYDESSVVITNDGTHRGLDEIRGLFEGLFADFDREGTTITVHMQEIEDDVAYITWEGETPDNDYEFATDTFVVEDGVITTQTFAGVIEPKE
jgi:ketosteroid isomerase-like protein